MRGTEVAIVDCIRRWAMQYPRELVALDYQMKRERERLAHPHTGMSRAGHFLKKAEIPVTLFWMMKQEIDPGWIDNPEIRRLFHQHFKVGLINTKSEMTR